MLDVPHATWDKKKEQQEDEDETPLMAKSLLKLLLTAFRELHMQESFRMKTDNDPPGHIRFNQHLINYRDDSSSTLSSTRSSLF